MYQLAPSVISADFKHIQAVMERLERQDIRYLHVDIMDGQFVPNLSLGFCFLKSIRDGSHLIFDVHMMVEEPARFIEELADAGADVVTVHYEACSELLETIKKIHAHGLKAGVVLSPDTPMEVLTDEIYESVDVIQVMSTYPGIAGQDFIKDSLIKIEKIRQELEKRKLSVDLEVDGDINRDNLPDVLQAGANIIVSGTAVFSGDLEKNVKEFQLLLKQTRGKRYELFYRN